MYMNEVRYSILTLLTRDFVTTNRRNLEGGVPVILSLFNSSNMIDFQKVFQTHSIQ